MTLVIRIDMDNAAFAEDASQEASRILRKLAEQIDGDPHFSPGASKDIFDINGNNVGAANVVR